MAEEQRATTSEVETLPLESILDRLGHVVERLEKGDVALEESLKIFEEGIRLTREGQRRLDAAERRVEQLITGEDGGVTTQPITPRGG